MTPPGLPLTLTLSPKGRGELEEGLTVTPPSLPLVRGGTFRNPLLAKEGCGEVTVSVPSIEGRE